MFELAFYIALWLIFLPLILTICGVVIMGIGCLIGEIIKEIGEAVSWVGRALTSPILWMVVGGLLIVVSLAAMVS